MRIKIVLACLLLLCAVIAYHDLTLSILAPHLQHRMPATFAVQQSDTHLYYFQHASSNSTVVINQPLKSSGCTHSLTLKPGTATAVGMMSGNGIREYRLYLPNHYGNMTQHALVLNFHGYASSASKQEKLSGFDTLADNNDFIVVYPQGSTGTTSKAAGWNTGLHTDITSNDVLFVSAMLNQLQSNLCIDPTRIYATGFSNGGGFVNELACSLSNRIAAFAPVSGSYVTPFKKCTVDRPISLMEFHGTSDKTVPYNGNRKVKELGVLSWANLWAKQDNCHPKPTISHDLKNAIEYNWSDCNGQAAIIHYRLSGEHHIWPVTHFQQTIEGKTQSISASALIWSFFEQHPLNPTSKQQAPLSHPV